MLKRMSIVTFALAVTLVTGGVAFAAQDVTDAATTAAVKSKFLGDTKVSGLNINVDTRDNVVTLTGTVHSTAEKAEAERLARNTTGVKSVISKLTVDPKKTPANDTTAAVKTKLLGDTKVSGMKIDVDTKDNVVTLTGTVNSAAEKTEALRLAKNTTGVKRVIDKLTIAPKH